MTSGRDPTARLRCGLNPLLHSSLSAFHSHFSNSPRLSAVSMVSPTPFCGAQAPLSTIQPYNPQQWTASPGPVAEQRVRADETPQGSPPPPPPYSPPRNQGPVNIVSDFPQSQRANALVARAPPPPAIPVNPSFPPPPGSRGSSRERRFGIPSLGRRREPEPTIAAPLENRSAIHTPIMAPRHHRGPPTLQIPQRSDWTYSMNVAPGARRTASTPAMGTPTSERSHSSPQVRWDHPCMPLPPPPPPPGPPPSAFRSQSVYHPSAGSDPIISPPTRRPAPTGVTVLGPVPPTPANWEEVEAASRSLSSDHHSPPVEASRHEPQAPEEPCANRTHPDSAPNSAGLYRTHALRGDKSLRERRNESRTRGQQTSSRCVLTDIVIPSSSTRLTCRMTIGRGTPGSGRLDETPQTCEWNASSAPEQSKCNQQSQQAANLTARVPDSAVLPAGHGSSTPPFSSQPPEMQRSSDGHRQVMPKALPTPPPQSRSSSSSQVQRPSLDTAYLAPAQSAMKPVSGSWNRQAVVAMSADKFTQASFERFQAFARMEAAAAEDADRVRLFADFFVSESRIRRERYTGAINAMGSEILDLTRDLFRPMAPRRESAHSRTSASEPSPAMPEPEHNSSSLTGSAVSGNPENQPDSTSTPSSSAPSSFAAAPSGNPNWQMSNYMPSLSPILSMSISDANEHDSRGRPASRWWEAGSSGADSIRSERSKRESKYMGVPKEAWEALQWADGPTVHASSSQHNSDEYPPEKTGLHDQQEQVRTPQATSRRSLGCLSSPNTPKPAHLDISRLVTLPPPYPRHHPAVNNNHPELAHTRNSVRILSDMTEVEATKMRFQGNYAEIRATATTASEKRLQTLRQNLQQEISKGTMSYAEAASIEADATQVENSQLQGLDKTEFDNYQTAVVVPLNELLQERINSATKLFDELRSRLFVETREHNPNMAQEEGDEQPELLEKLTLLKWIFETRETLHRAVHHLLTKRNDRYRDLIITTYRLAPNSADKLASAKDFFADDARKRQLFFAEEVLGRTQEFRDIMEETVVRGVEAQLSAFWDIAPPLKRVLDGVPPASGLAGFRVQISATELGENPAYEQHPLQYLFALVLHAEKSTYQLIESQTNLLCLLHEIKEAVVGAKGRVMEAERRDAARVQEDGKEEAARLTEDLKEKVRWVEGQWREALGDCIGGVKERVGGWLLETGGWDESLEEGSVGGA